MVSANKNTRRIQGRATCDLSTMMASEPAGARILGMYVFMVGNFQQSMDQPDMVAISPRGQLNTDLFFPDSVHAGEFRDGGEID